MACSSNPTWQWAAQADWINMFHLEFIHHLLFMFCSGIIDEYFNYTLTSWLILHTASNQRRKKKKSLTVVFHCTCLVVLLLTAPLFWLSVATEGYRSNLPGRGLHCFDAVMQPLASPSCTLPQYSSAQINSPWKACVWQLFPELFHKLWSVKANKRIFVLGVFFSGMWATYLLYYRDLLSLGLLSPV